MPRQRKTAKERIEEIQSAACEVFLTYGLQQATMEAIVERTSLSKGGLYHYYNNPYDILYDVMMEANATRIESIEAYFSSHKPPEDPTERLRTYADLLLEKVMTDHPLTKLYVMLVIEAQTDPRYGALYRRICEDCTEDLEGVFRKKIPSAHGDQDVFFHINHLVNMFVASCHLMGAYDYWRSRQDQVYAMLMAYLSHIEKP